MSLRQPVVIDVPFHEDDIKIEQSIDQVPCEVDGSELSSGARRLLKTYPTVYIIRAKQRGRTRGGYEFDEFILYVGETNSIVRRTREHYSDDITYRTERGRQAWEQLIRPGSRMLVIGQDHFNKSLTLDLENNFLSYLLASGAEHVTLANGRGNPQENYYTKPELPIITSAVWRKLNRYEPELFPAESVIRDSAIFKASPFRALGKDQLAAEDVILGRLRELMAARAGAPHADADAPVKDGELIVVEGMAGTGKTVLLSHLFLRVMNELEVEDGGGAGAAGAAAAAARRSVSACLLVNHNEQLTVYNAIMKRLGLQNRDGVVVDKPTRFINKHSEAGHGGGHERQNYPCDPVDVVLIDEAHLLLTQGNQGYTGSRNMLVDIMRRARVVVAVYDLEQVLRKSQELDAAMRSALFPEGRFSNGQTVCARRATEVSGFPFHAENLLLRQQYRIDACDEVIAWIDDFANARGIRPIPRDLPRKEHIPYEIKVFSSPFDLKEAIQDKALTFDSATGAIVDSTSHGLSRVLATYDWPYSSKSKPTSGGVWEVRIYREENGWVSFGAGGRGSRRGRLSAATDSAPHTEYFHMPWNYQTSASEEQTASERDKAWAEQGHTLGECGSIYTIQGFDLNYAGVIIGPSICWREGRLAFDPSKSCNSQAINGSEDPEANLRHELNVLLKRGVHGLYLFAVDGALEHHLLEMQEAGA